MGELGPAAVLDAWDRGFAFGPLGRAPSLLTLLGHGAGTGAMTIGECDLHLLELRRLLFGSTVEAEGLCPGCGERMALDLTIEDLLRAPPVERTTTVSLGALEVECRLPVNDDLLALGRLGRAPEPADLLDRCVVAVRSPAGAEVPPGVPAEWGGELLDALAAADPAAHLSLSLACPACEEEWVEIFDIRGYIWSELTAWAKDLLLEIHRLAAVYGWTEDEVLKLSPRRRRIYLEACGW